LGSSVSAGGGEEQVGEIKSESETQWPERLISGTKMTRGVVARQRVWGTGAEKGLAVKGNSGGGGEAGEARPRGVGHLFGGGKTRKCKMAGGVHQDRRKGFGETLKAAWGGKMRGHLQNAPRRARKWEVHSLVAQRKKKKKRLVPRYPPLMKLGTKFC